MTRAVFVKAARKDNPAVKAGESYWWWKFRYGGKHYSRERPRPSQLTQSPYYQGVRSLGETVEDWDPVDADDVEAMRDQAVSDLQEMLDTCQENLDNIPEALKDGSSGETLQNRIGELESAIGELESLDAAFDEDDGEELQDWIDSRKQEILEFINACEV